MNWTKKKKGKKRVAYTSPHNKGQAFEKIFKKKKRRRRRKELCGTKRTLEKSVRSTTVH
jgi:hypothetical protein